MLPSVIVFSALAASALAIPVDPVDKIEFASCEYPNNTANALHMYSCSTSGDTIEVKWVRVTDLNGVDIYPIDPKQPVILELAAYNNGPDYADNKADVRIFEYQKSWQTGVCGWAEVPTFGQLNGIDGCEFAHNCPLTAGDLDLKIELDLSPYANIISMLTANSAIQIQISMKDYNPGSSHEEITCVVAQLKIV
ncbi:hypothetical protein PENTCL1PPCAC_1483 [Pristionchus entomophagus]|uniref:MD-2-related lipid-recognition domain-containing protein n=1 Tax=Pristionchus entomophagus TaxID=358040 RepID=A0AAV5S956_9BILA|nr:hypothetical protein PENTCL1PPCAC_1483 [Pristionchus entomophagus]